MGVRMLKFARREVLLQEHHYTVSSGHGVGRWEKGPMLVLRFLWGEAR